MTYVWIIGLIVGIIIAGVIFWRRFGEMMQEYPMLWDRQLIRERVGYTWWVFLGTNAGVLLNQVDMQFALYFLGKEAA
jgi:O-antigen/teichoic acid export membrane protein